MGRGTTDRRVLVVGASRADEATILRLLRVAGIRGLVCHGLGDWAEALDDGAGAAVVTEEAVDDPYLALLERQRKSEPRWSDLPIVLLTLPARESGSAVERFWEIGCGHVTVLERPVRSTALIAAVRTALQSRAAQYAVRDELERRRQAEQVVRAKSALLEEVDRRKDLFLATLGHELRNPLAALDLKLRLIEDGTRSIDESRPRLAAQVEQLTALVDDLLEVSRITQGKVVLRKQPTDLAGVIRRSCEAQDHELRQKHQSLALSLPDRLDVEADPLRLEQVVTNLLLNASRYTPVHGRIELEARSEEGSAVLVVRDTGPGLERAELETIFEPFVQADTMSGGLGIGLALVKGLVEQHGGRVEAESAGRGQGAVFTVRLPVGRVRGQRAARRPRSAARLPRPLRVLIVDDQRDYADSLALLVGRMGADVRVANAVEEALDVAPAFRPEAMLVDLKLPDGTGYDLLARLREEEWAADALFLAITGFGSEETEERAREAGFAERLVKPVDTPRLRALLQGAADGSPPGEAGDASVGPSGRTDTAESTATDEATAPHTAAAIPRAR